MAATRRLAAAREVLPFFIDADATPNPGGLPVGGVTIVDLPNNHLQYAVTWYGLAAPLAGVVRGLAVAFPKAQVARPPPLTGQGARHHFGRFANAPEVMPSHLTETAADDQALPAARLLRRRRPRDPDRRAGAEEIRRAGLCAPRDRAQPLRRRRAAESRRGLHRGASRDPARASAMPGRVFRAWRAEIGAGRRPGAQPLLSRRDLPAGLQGPQAGDAPPAARPPCAADRPCRPSRGDRHDGAAAGGRGDADRDRGRRRGLRAGRSVQRSASSRRRRCRSRTPPASSARCRRAFPRSRRRPRNRSATPPPTARKR